MVKGAVRKSVWLFMLWLMALGFASIHAAGQIEPSSWSGTSIGKGIATGSFQSLEQMIVVKGSGADIWREADSFHFTYLPWQGDGEFIARVVEVGNTDPWAKAGLMFRESLTETSPHAMIAITPEQGASFLRRSWSAGPTIDDSHQAMRMVAGARGPSFQQRGSAGTDKATGSLVSSRPPRWVKLVRRGDTISGYDSADGVKWEWLGTDRVVMTASIFVGLAVTSHDATKLCAATFDHISLVEPQKGAPELVRNTGSGSGLKGTYFNSRDHSGRGIERLDATVDFNWGLGSPMAELRADEFTVRWEGELEAPLTEPYSLHVVSEDRSRLWLNGELIIDEWYEHGEAKSTAVVNLEAGRRYLVRLDYFENRGPAMVRLLWSSPTIPVQPIPQFQLYPEVADKDNNGLPDLWEALEGAKSGGAMEGGRQQPVEPLSQREKYRKQFETTVAPRKARSELATPWSHDDVGRVGLEGEAVASDGQWTVKGAGVDIWANSDGFHFVYQPWHGDGEIVARVASQERTDPWAKAGVMIREGLSAEARHVLMAVTPDTGVWFMQRTQNAAPSNQDQAGSLYASNWLRLVRRGNSFAGYRSADGRNWEWVGTESIDMQDDVLIGLAVNSHDNSELGTVVFDGVSMNRPHGGEKAEANAPGKGTGLRGTYLDTVSGKTVSRLDPQVDFDWRYGSPAEGIAENSFTVRWEGWLEAPLDGLYSLDILSDDGARLWLGGKLLIDAWNDQAALHSSAKIRLKARERLAIRIEYFERERDAIAKLLWSTETLPRQPIPSSQLYPALLSNTGGGHSDPTNPEDPKGGEDPDNRKLSEERSKQILADLPTGITGISTSIELAGSTAVNKIGRWELDGGEIYAVDRRGSLDYEMNISTPDIYRFEVEGTSQNKGDPESGFYLVLSVDGEHLERVLLSAAPGQNGQAGALTPFLGAGKHRFTVYWDNPRKGRSFRLKTLRLQRFDGPDSDNNGVKDWVEAKLSRESRTDDSSDVISSVTSPACIEGSGRFLSMMRLDAGGMELRAEHGAGDRWYSNIPLSKTAESPVTLSYQNGGRVETKRLVWRAVDILESETLVIRKGDSLLLTASSKNEGGDGQVEILMEGAQVYAGAAGEKYERKFGAAGQFEIVGTFIPAQGRMRTRAIQVLVLDGTMPESAAAWVGKKRVLDCPLLPKEAVVEFDPRLQNAKSIVSRSGGRELSFSSDAPELRGIVSRVGPGGSILGACRVEGCNIYSSTSTDFSVVEVLPDQSLRIEMTIVLSPLRERLRFTVDLLVGGVLFEDGTVGVQWQADSMGPLGEGAVRFIRPANVPTSACHRLSVWDGPDLVGTN